MALRYAVLQIVRKLHRYWRRRHGYGQNDTV